MESDLIIAEPELYIPDSRGIGVVLMESMQKYKTNSAQINAETGETITYNELLLKCIRVAEQLTVRGIKSNDIITICSYNNMDNAIPLFACLFLGIRVACIDPSFTKRDVKQLLTNVTPRMYFCDSVGLALIESTLEENGEKQDIVVFGESQNHIQFSEFLTSSGNENVFQAKSVNDLFDPALIFFSSGSTGLPKAVYLSHYGLLGQAIHFVPAIDSSVIVHFQNYFCMSAFKLLTYSILSGGQRIVCKKFDIDTAMTIIQDFKVTFTFLEPTESYMLTNRYKSSDFDTSAFHSLLVGGGIIGDGQIQALQQLFPHTQFLQIYGMTEVSGPVTFFNPKTDKYLMEKYPSSCGRPMPGFTFKLVNCTTGQICGPNEPGEVRIKSRYIFVGYHNQPEIMESLFDVEGYFSTGDYGYYNEDRCFFILDRVKSLIKYNGWQVSPSEIEKVLMDHPKVETAVVIGMPHDTDGEHPMAFVVLNPEANVTPGELVQYTDDVLEGCEWKKLRAGIRFMKEIPKTPSGKPKRWFLRDLAISTAE